MMEQLRKLVVINIYLFDILINNKIFIFHKFIWFPYYLLHPNLPFLHKTMH
jgi:hypothetical protein